MSALPDVTLADIEAAARRLEGQVLDTPCVESKTLSQLIGARVFLKFENLQFTASFKERGALNKLLVLTESAQARGETIRGVIAASAGNHAQGVAHHAQRLGLRAVIVMPLTTPMVKVERTRGFGAEVVLHGETFDAARDHALVDAEAAALDDALLQAPALVAGELEVQIGIIDTVLADHAQRLGQRGLVEVERGEQRGLRHGQALHRGFAGNHGQAFQRQGHWRSERIVGAAGRGASRVAPAVQPQRGLAGPSAGRDR